MTVIELKDVYYSYGNKNNLVNALDGVNCAFEAGKVHAVVGKSGSGKSTMLSLMAGLDVPQRGDVLFEGKSTNDMDLTKYRRDHAAVIYQSYRLLPLLTAVENVMYPMELRGEHGINAMERARALIRKVSLPDSVFDRFPSMLSGGEQQRVAIARALSMNSRLMLADEPTGNLDTDNGDKIIDILSKLAHEDGYCVIIATHDLGVLDRMDVVMRMSDGHLVKVEK